MSVNKYDKINNRLLPFAGNGGGGGSAGIRYDEENDVIQLFYDGEWVDWKSGGMAYPVGTQTTFSYKGSVDAFEIPATGYWQIELFGAGTGEGQNYEAKGGKTIIYEELQKDDIVYVCVGGTASGTTGGYNGGGNGYTGTSTTPGHGGAGATHVAMMDGTLRSIGAENIQQVLGVAGGAGGMTQNNAKGGVGGGLTGENGRTAGYAVGLVGGGGGSQSVQGVNASGNGSGGVTVTSSTPGGFGYGGTGTSNNQGICGGGGGLYGGGFGIWDGSGGGGSGYIKDDTSVTIGTITYTPSTTQGVGLGGNGSCIFTYLGRA